MADSYEPLQYDDDNDDDDAPPPIPLSSPLSSGAAPPPSNAHRVRKRANSWSAPAGVPPPLPSAPLPVALASQSASKLLQKSLEALRSGERVGRHQSDADVAFQQLVAAATEAAIGVGIRISTAQPVTCTAVFDGQSAARHPLSRRFLGSKIIAINGVDVSSMTQDQVRELILGPFGSICEIEFVDGGGVVFAAALLRANPEFFTSYHEQVKRVGSMVSPSVSAAVQAHNAALQQKVAKLQLQLKEAEDKVDECARTLESAHQHVKTQEESVALSKILEEESNLSEICELEARVLHLTREISLKDSIICKHDQSETSHAQTQAALQAEVSRLQNKCATLEQEKLEFAAGSKALEAKFAAQQRAAHDAAAAQQGALNNQAISELMHLLSEFEVKVPKLSSKITHLEVDLQAERQLGSRRQAELEAALARESCLNDRVQQLEEQLQQAAARTLNALSSSLAPPRRRDVVIDCFDGLADDAWSAAVQRHAVSIVVSSLVERAVARASARSFIRRQQPAEPRSRSAAVVAVHDVATQAGCSAGDAGNLTTMVALDLSQCLDPLAKAAGLPLPPNLCFLAVDSVVRALLNNDCSACTLTGVAAWCAQAAEKTRSFELRAIATEGERDGLLHFRDQMLLENSRLMTLHETQQRRLKDVESAMLTSVNDVQQLSQQMGSLLSIIKDKSAENTDLVRQTTRLKQLLTIQNDLRLQIEGQKQQLLQYQVIERESLQLKVTFVSSNCTFLFAHFSITMPSSSSSSSLSPPPPPPPPSRSPFADVS
jgi:hypothetical protein